MTEQELLADGHFLGACKVWEREKRCPYKLVDWFLDRDLEDMAEAARWCHETWLESIATKKYSGYACPFFCKSKSYQLTRRDYNSYYGRDYDCVYAKFENHVNFKHFLNFSKAIAWLMVNFDHEAAFARTSAE